MLRTVANLPGDSFEERWAEAEARVRRKCEQVDAPFPQKTLHVVRPWFKTIGEWFDWAAPAMNEFIVPPRDEEPVLRILREADQLLNRYGEKAVGSRHGLLGERTYRVSTIKRVNSLLLTVVPSPPRDSGRQGPPDDSGFTDLAVYSLAEYLLLTGHPVHWSRWPRVKSVLYRRADQEDEDFDSIVAQSLKNAVLLAIHDLYGDVEMPTEPGVSASAKSFVEHRKVGQLLVESLIPGVDASSLRASVNRFLTEDALGPRWRREQQERDVRWGELDAKTREKAKIQFSQAVRQEKAVLAKLYAEELLSLAGLSDRQREVCRLYYEEGLTGVGIAEQLAVSPSTVRSHLALAHEKLRKADS